MKGSRNMKVGVFYASDTGTTAKCAKIIYEKIPNSDLKELEGKEVLLEDYDYVIIGTPLIISRFHKRVRRFLKTNKDKLVGKVAFFICHGFDIDANQVLKANLDGELEKEVRLVRGFGGEIHIDKLRGINKFIVKMVTKSNKHNLPQLNMQSIHDFIKDFNLLLERGN